MGEDATQLRHETLSLAHQGIVLFVCVEDTFRSIMSEAIFNASSPLGWRAESAGVRAARSINPVAVALLGEIGLTLKARAPRQVTPEMIALADRVITFGCLDRCPIGAKEKAVDWQIPGATGKTMEELRAIRDDLLQLIAALKLQLSANFT